MVRRLVSRRVPPDPMEDYLLEHWAHPGRQALSAVVNWLDAVLSSEPQPCAYCGKGGPDVMPQECWLHWLQIRLERADDKQHNANAIRLWARAIGTRHAPCDLWEDAVVFGDAYALKVMELWERSLQTNLTGRPIMGHDY